MSEHPMHIVTQREVIRGVVERWWNSYAGSIQDPSKDGPWVHGKTKRQIYEELKTLDLKTATAEQVNAIIGNDSWTALRCNECDRDDHEQILQFGVVDYDSPHFALCPKCVHAAFALWETRS
jgi:hypothetical protein